MISLFVVVLVVVVGGGCWVWFFFFLLLFFFCSVFIAYSDKTRELTFGLSDFISIRINYFLIKFVMLYSNKSRTLNKGCERIQDWAVAGFKIGYSFRFTHSPMYPAYIKMPWILFQTIEVTYGRRYGEI